MVAGGGDAASMRRFLRRFFSQPVFYREKIAAILDSTKVHKVSKRIDDSLLTRFLQRKDGRLAVASRSPRGRLAVASRIDGPIHGASLGDRPHLPLLPRALILTARFDRRHMTCRRRRNSTTALLACQPCPFTVGSAHTNLSGRLTYLGKQLI